MYKISLKYNILGHFIEIVLPDGLRSIELKKDEMFPSVLFEL